MDPAAATPGLGRETAEPPPLDEPGVGITGVTGSITGSGTGGSTTTGAGRP